MNNLGKLERSDKRYKHSLKNLIYEEYVLIYINDGFF